MWNKYEVILNMAGNIYRIEEIIFIFIYLDIHFSRRNVNSYMLSIFQINKF